MPLERPGPVVSTATFRSIMGRAPAHRQMDHALNQNSMYRIVSLLLLAVGALSSVVLQAQPHGREAFTRQYCLGCHNQRFKAAGLVLEGVFHTQTAVRPDVWEKVVKKVRSGDMDSLARPKRRARRLLTVSLPISTKHSSGSLTPAGLLFAA